MENKSIIYINFAPYDNAGRILDYLLENFSQVAHFSFDFHNLNAKTVTNVLRTYERGKQTSQVRLFKLPTPEWLIFISLPFIATLIAIGTIWHVFRLYRRQGKFSLFFSVNAFTVWLGNVLRRVGWVDKTVFWVWDYYPPGYPDWKIRLARWGYWKFDRWSTTSSDRVVFLNRKLEDLRREIGVLPPDSAYPVVPIGTNPRPNSPQSGAGPRVGHLGVLKRGQGLDLLFDNLEELFRLIPALQVEIIGSGPDEKYFKERAQRFHGHAITFFGFLESNERLDEIMRSWDIGLATYIPGKSNESHWTDPSKIKAYVSMGIPVITTNVTDFSKEIEQAKAGVVVDYFAEGDFVDAVRRVWAERDAFGKGATSLGEKYNYKTIYMELFRGL